MLTLEQVRDKRQVLIALANRCKAENVRVFGSVARGEANEESDLDLLVHFRDGASLFDLIDLKEEAEKLLGLDVDVVSDGGLSPYLKDRILNEARPLCRWIEAYFLCMPSIASILSPNNCNRSKSMTFWKTVLSAMRFCATSKS